MKIDAIQFFPGEKWNAEIRLPSGPGGTTLYCTASFEVSQSGSIQNISLSMPVAGSVADVLRHGEFISMKSADGMMSADFRIFDAAITNDTALAKQFFSDGCEISRPLRNRIGPLHFAAENGSADVARVILASSEA